MELALKDRELKIREIDQRQKDEAIYMSTTDEELNPVIRREAMAEEDAFLVDDVEGGLCADNTDAGIDGRCNSESNKDKSKESWDSFEFKYMAEDSSSKKFLSISVSSVIDKLPPSWKEFKHTLKHGKDDLSLVQLGSHLCIEESLREQENDKGKGKEVVGPSVNMAEGGIAVVKTRRITKMLVVRERGLRTNPKTKVDAIAWWIDSGATTHVCKDRCWFKTYEPVDDGSVLYMGDDHFTPVQGKGSVVLEFSSGKYITLFNV
ncbi:hypothetical protein Tco_1020666, partial [Tanacetum coccineum]